MRYSFFHVKNILVVPHLHGETGLSTVCANGKQKCLIEDFVRIGHSPLLKIPELTEKD